MSDAKQKRPYLLRILGTWGVFLCVLGALTLPLGPLPPLGSFLSPATGFLRNAPSNSKQSDPQVLTLSGLRSEVTISVDIRGVPHVTASNDTDLAFGQGYITARDRLWQMELQTAATAGRVAEILGAKAVDFDIKQRKFGFLSAAAAEVEFLQKNDPDQFQMLLAYSKGVNAYIDSLEPATLPLEYKLLGTRPEPWTPLKCALFHKQMTWILTGNEDDFKFTNALQKYSDEEMENLFPSFLAGSTPILDEKIAQMSTSDLTGFNSVTSPFIPDGLFQLSELPVKNKDSRSGTNGSNNWVVDGVHTSHGYPVLANDPHLDLKLPSIWYEIQLTAPSVNVYGASLPGLPHVIIGFNENTSWGITNAGVDVIDWYAMTLDRSQPTPKYLFGEQWRDAEVRKEIIRVKGEPPREIETIQTHLGPIAKEVSVEKKNGGLQTLPIAMKWTGHSPSNEFRVFFNLNRARSVMDCKSALTAYEAPGQNFVLADKTGSIGLVQAGRFPMRSAGFGRTVLDGSNPVTEWKDFIPFSHLPQSWSPERGHLSSANQQPTRMRPNGFDSGDWGFTSYLRGKRIAEKLATVETGEPATIGELMKLQNDVVDLRAKELLPTLLNWVQGKTKSEEAKESIRLLSRWNFELKADSVEAALWSEWWSQFYDMIWEKAFPKPNFLPPSEDRTMELLLASTSGHWPENTNVPKFSSLPDLAAVALEQAVKTLKLAANNQELDNTLPMWGQYRGTNIPHLARLPGFGFEKLNTSGNGNTVNATTEKHGPSWRMVVTWVDALPKAWGIYPGGQSGHVGSVFYANMMSSWLKGELDQLLFVQQGTLKESLTMERIKLEKIK
ncbi:MAG: hypothetical protein RIR26_2178 [Pseudomonadota bacterium]